MTRKKIVLVIVEGPTDDIALGVALNEFFDKDSVFVHVIHGDITTRIGVNPENIISKVVDEIKKFAKKGPFKPSDFKQVIHIVDTDGTYIPNSKIIEKAELEKPYYSLDGIFASNVQGIIDRNNRKEDNIYRLRTTGRVWNTIPYRIYYMSCNLDHVLHNKMNSSNEEKEDDAYEFAEKYKNNVDGFVKFICESPFSVTTSFKESWTFIEQDKHSLGRYTNLGICLQEEIKENKT